jgi:hypothetical protein
MRLVHAAQEHQVHDLRHVDAGGEQVHRDGDAFGSRSFLNGG